MSRWRLRSGRSPITHSLPASSAEGDDSPTPRSNPSRMPWIRIDNPMSEANVHGRPSADFEKSGRFRHAAGVVAAPLNLPRADQAGCCFAGEMGDDAAKGREKSHNDHAVSTPGCGSFFSAPPSLRHARAPRCRSPVRVIANPVCTDVSAGSGMQAVRRPAVSETGVSLCTATSRQLCPPRPARASPAATRTEQVNPGRRRTRGHAPSPIAPIRTFDRISCIQCLETPV